jgi:iron complex outermembrane recepter protein
MIAFRGYVLTGVSALALATPAFAQDASRDSNETRGEEIIVTGTLVRGVQPTGTTVIAVDEAQVEASGASTVTQLIQTVPQFDSFNTAQAPVGGGNTVTTNRPNLRGLPASNLNGAASTLMLVDGHRIVGMGIQQTSPDLDTIAPGAIERVEIVPDGGSSIYGADAVGGVLNFITRKTFDGVEVNGRFGFADNYNTWDANATVGTTWNRGGVYISYNYSQHDPIYGRDRNWVTQYPTQISGVAVPTIGIECRSPNVQVTGSSNIYGMPFTPSTAAKLNQPNQCDYSDPVTVYPQERRHSVFARLNQDLNDSLTFDLSSFFMDRKQRLSNGYFHTNKTITATGSLRSPFRSQNIIISPTESQRVYFAWGPDDAVQQEVHLQAWGVSPTLTARLDDNWQARLLFNYGESVTTVHSPSFNDTALNNAINAGLFNPYAPATSNASALAAISNWETFGQAKQSQLQARAIFDGELFQLPGGGVKVAVGAEFLRETLRSQKGSVVPGTQNTGFPGQSVNGILILPGTTNRLPIFRTARNVKSVFGEIVLPVLADTPGFQELTLSASGRYDSYSDVGDTFNPKFGLTWKPFEQLRIRGQWGKSFSAPSLANSADADPATATFSSGFVFNFLVSPGVGVLTGLGFPPPTAQNSTILTLGGGSNDLEPQTATAWSVGADLDPFDGARLSLTYWNISYENLIGVPAFFNPAVYFDTYRSSYDILPALSPAEAAAAIRKVLDAAAIVNGSQCGLANPSDAQLAQCVYVVERNVTQNLGRFRNSGLDFAATYRTDTGFGSIDFSLFGTYLLTRERSVSATAPLVDQIPFGESRLNFRTTLGAQVRQLRAQATWNYRAGYDFSPANAGLAPFYPTQNHIGSFSTVDLFFKYDFEGEGEGAMRDLALTLGVNNVFDADPPVRYVGGSTPSQFGYANGSTIGRLVQIGFSKRF